MSPGGLRAKYGAALQFARDVAVGGHVGCVDWPYLSNAKGYPIVRKAGRQLRATVVVLELSGRPRPGPDYEAAHDPVLCNRRGCVNPDHLRWALHADNIADKVLAGTVCRGEGRPAAKLTEALVREIRASRVSSQEWARRLGIGRRTIDKARSRATWKHVE
jgi:hypothetical protein